MENRHGLYQDGYGDTLPGPDARKRVYGDLGRSGDTQTRHKAAEAAEIA
jgi:hypothetical protein